VEIKSCPEIESIPRGWALKESKKGQRLSEKRKAYLDESFNKGKVSGHKMDPAIVAQEMHFAKDLDGNHRFKIAAFLLARQIQRYFSRKAYKDRRGTEDIHEGDDDQAAQEEDAYLCMY
jgi:hypothetical protein